MSKVTCIFLLCLTGALSEEPQKEYAPNGSGSEYVKLLDELQGGASFFQKKMHDRKVLGTLTAFLSAPGKFEEATTALRSIAEHEPRFKSKQSLFVVVNEVPKDGTSVDEGRLQEFLKEFDWVRFIQKEGDMRKQANSLNLINGLLRAGKFDYVLQFEEGWHLKKPVVEYGMKILDANEGLSQLSIVDDGDQAMWGKHETKVETADSCHITETMDSDNDRAGFVSSRFGNCENPDVSNFHFDFHDWPMFSLQPSLQRASHVTRAGSFDAGFLPCNNGNNWPGIFELKFGLQWYCKGGTRAKLCDAAADWNEGHTHTSDLNFRQKLFGQKSVHELLAKETNNKANAMQKKLEATTLKTVGYLNTNKQPVPDLTVADKKKEEKRPYAAFDEKHWDCVGSAEDCD